MPPVPQLQSARITLRDVARAAGVSTASASRALAGHTAVTADLHRRIMAAAARLGYLPNLAARTLASQRSGLIGIVAATLTDDVAAAAVEAAERQLADQGYGAILSIGMDPGGHVAAVTGSFAWAAEAILFVGIRPRPSVIEALAGRHVPWVAVAESEDGAPSVIDPGQAKGGALAARYLLDLGHRRLGVLAPVESGCRRGVASALAGTGATWVAEAPADGEDFNARSAAIHRLLDHPDSVSVVVCSGDAEALATSRECALRGIAVPEEVSIIGFGDTTYARCTRPALTTIRVSPTDMGVRAAEALLHQLSGGVPERYEPPVKLVIRESSGPPPHRSL
jgi:LacI family transcriptional regulator, galactose operon repressor